EREQYESSEGKRTEDPGLHDEVQPEVVHRLLVEELLESDLVGEQLVGAVGPVDGRRVPRRDGTPIAPRPDPQDGVLGQDRSGIAYQPCAKIAPAGDPQRSIDGRAQEIAARDVARGRRW